MNPKSLSYRLLHPQFSLSKRPIVKGAGTFSAALVTAALALICASPADAASGTWGVNTDGVWSNSANWTSGTIADGAGSTANVSFNITATRTVTLDTSRSLGIVNIGDITTSSNSFILATGSNVLTFDNVAANGQLNQTSLSFGDTVSGLLAIAGNGNVTVTNAASGKTFTLSAGITSALASGTQTLAFNNANQVNYSGIIGDGVTGGKIAVTKSGVGLTNLSNTNTYTGGTVINAGVLQFASAGAIGGSTNDVTVNYGGAAGFGYAVAQSDLTGRIVANSLGTIALGITTANNLDFGAAGLGNLSLGAVTGTTSTYNGTLWTPTGGIYRLGGGGGTLVMTPALTGANSLLVGGSGSSGTVTLAAAGTYTAGTTVNAGSTLQTNVLTGTSNTPFGTGAITLKGGAIGVGTAGNLSSGQVVDVSGYTVNYQGVGEIKTSKGLGASVNFTATSYNQVGNSVLYVTPSVSGNLGVSEFVKTSGTAPTVTNGMVAPYIIDNTSKTFLTYGANGFVDATTTGTFGVNNIVSTGTTGVGAQSAYAVRVTTNLGATDNFTIGSGGFIETGGNNGAGTVNFGGVRGYVGVFNAGNFGTNFTGTNGATFYGTGATVTNSNIGITGGITFASGTWNLSPSPAGSELFNILNPNALTVYSGATLNSTSNTPSTFASLSGDGLITSNGGTFSLTINGFTDTSTSTFRGLITDTNGAVTSITKRGANTQVLTNANTYSGATTAAGGTLRLDFTDATAPVINIINNTANSSALTVAGGTLDVVGKASTANTQRFNGFNVNAGNSAVTVSSGASGTTDVDLGALGTRAVGGTVNFVLPTASVGTSGIALSGGTVVNSVLTSGNTAFATVGADWAGQTGGFITAMSTYDTNDFSAATKNTDSTITQTAATGFTVNTLRFNNASTTLTLAGTNTIGTGGLLVTGAATGTTITGGTLKSSAGNEMVIINNGGLTVSSVIANGAAASALTLSGSGTTTLNGSNTFTGNTNINSGTVIAGNANAFGTAGTINLNGGTLATSTALTISRGLSIGVNSIIGGSNAMTLSGGVTGSAGGLNTLTVNNTALTTISGTVSITASTFATGNVLTIKGAGDLLISGVVNGGTGAGTATSNNLNYDGTGTLTLSNAASNYGGATRITNTGVLSVSTLANGAAASSIGKSSNIASNLTINGGTLKYTGAAVSTDRLFSVGAAGATVDASGTGAVNFTNTGAVGLNNTTGSGASGFINNAGARTLTLTGSNTGGNTLAASLADQSATYATSLSKTGAGQWIVSGANTYSGGTTVSAGTLLLNNSTGSGTGTGGIAASGTGLVGGTGTAGVAGVSNISFATGSGVDLTSTAGTNTLTFALTGTGSATFDAGSTFAFDLAASNASDVLALTGMSDASVANFNLNSVTVTNSAIGLYTLFTFDGATALDNYSGTLSNTVAGLSGGQAANWIYNANSIQLNIAAVPEPSTYGLIGMGLGALWFLRRRKATVSQS